jgi:Ubiquitin-2 like Rad60 SUMO-like
MAEEPIEVRFRLFDGTDIGPDKYDPSTTVASLKERIISRWPQGEIFVLVFSTYCWSVKICLDLLNCHFRE